MHIGKHKYALAVIAAFVAAVSCGYGLRGSSPLAEIRIGPIINKTLHPGLEDTFKTVLMEELLRNGIRPSNSAEKAVTGTIDGLNLQNLIQKDGVTVYHGISISGSFALVDSVSLLNAPAPFSNAPSPDVSAYRAKNMASISNSPAHAQISNAEGIANAAGISKAAGIANAAGPRPLQGGMRFISTFESMGTLEELLALEEKAVEKALRLMARDIASEITYR